MKCETCGCETDLVKRVVIRQGYDRTLSKATYNCESCYQKKLKAKARVK